MKPEVVKSILDKIIAELSADPSLFVAHPGKDFTRDRKLPLETMLRIIIGMNGGSIKRELYDYDKSVSVTTSAFVQQRDKILPDMFGYIFRQFTDQLSCDKTYRGYRLLAVDGSGVSLAKDPDAETYVENGSLEGYNAFHLNALFDLCNKLYVDAIIEPHPGAEAKAAWTMVDRGRFQKALLMGDRGYSAMNLMEHIHRKPGLDYLFRVKNGWISELRKLPMVDFDIDISFELRTTQRKEDLALYRRGEAKLIYGPSKFGKTKKLEQWDFKSPFTMKLRVVRFKLSDTGDPSNQYETIVTSLDRNQFTPEELKKLYHMRWGIETSFRELKYAIGLSQIHTKKDTAAMQEVYARLTMYNFCECITMAVVIAQKDSRKWFYQVNFTYAIHICKDYFRHSSVDPPDLIKRIQAEILPVRPDRQDKRKNLHQKEFVWFMCRVA